MARRYQDNTEGAQAIRSEWTALAKLKRADLIGLVRQQYRVIDTNDCDKQSLVCLVVTANHGAKKVEAAFAK